MTPERIALIGLRGTGKTTVGQLVAEGLGWDFVDVDEVIEATAGRTVADIFGEVGEPAFRELEAAAVGGLCSGRRVLATGGGAVLRPDNRAALRTSGMVAWLTTPPAELWARLQADPATAARRPNLTAAGGLAEVEELLAKRAPLYRETATHTFDTGGQSPADVAAAILREWLRREPRPQGSV